MKKGKIRLLSALLSAVLVLGLLPATALADASTATELPLTGGTLNAGEYKLTADAPAGADGLAGDITISGDVTIYLNGHTLDLNGHHIDVGSSGNIGSLTVEGGGGTITGGHAAYGGAVRADYLATGVTLKDLTMCGNRCDTNGGAVCADSTTNGTLLKNCIITGNQSAYSGGGIACIGDVILDSCTITGNTATYYSGVYTALTRTYPIKLIGKNIIRDNYTPAGIEWNVGMNMSTRFALDDDHLPSGDSEIGVTGGRTPSIGNPVTISNTYATDCSSAFFSDKADQQVYYDESSQALMLRAALYAVTYDANNDSAESAVQYLFEDGGTPLPTCSFTAPAGKVFDGWEIDQVKYSPAEVYTFTADTTVYATWTEPGPGPGPGPTPTPTPTPTPSDDNYVRPEPIIGGLKPSAPEQPVQPIEPDPAAPVFTDVSPDAWYADAVDYCVSKGIMAGTGESQFSPETETSRGMVVQMLYSLAGKPEAGESAFADVAEDAWYADAVAWANSLGIVSGVGENAFAPEQAISREQLALILYKFAQFQGRDVTVDGDTNFMDYTDVRDIHDYAKTAFFWCIQEGLISGTGSDTLSPLTTATRAQLAQIMMNYDKK